MLKTNTNVDMIVQAIKLSYHSVSTHIMVNS